ncbi:MAG: lytic transglycosylase domain-containing protein [Desulfotomaculaceae bacterium]|nr:lytic transglycosylase domain-containing protein [Desulfotomaculaceae bacterium]
MATVYHRRLNRGKLKRRLILLLLFILLVCNFDHIARIIYPFPYREVVQHYAGAYGVDPFLVAAVMKAESSFNKNAVSERGARGLMQIMPETGQWAAGKIGGMAFSPERLFEPETNIKLGSWYIADLSKEFRGDIILVLAAYNGGRGNVQGWLTTGKMTPGQSSISQIPFTETRLFVKKVLSYYNIYRKLYQG